MKDLYRIILESRHFHKQCYQPSKISYFHHLLNKTCFTYVNQPLFHGIDLSRKYNYVALYLSNCSFLSKNSYENLFNECCRQGFVDGMKILIWYHSKYYYGDSYTMCIYVTQDNVKTALNYKKYKAALFLISYLFDTQYLFNIIFDELFQTVYKYHSHQYKILKLLLRNVSTSMIVECFDYSFNIHVYHLIAKHKPHRLNRTLKRRYQKYLKMKIIE